jgi:hypothetical protein
MVLALARAVLAAGQVQHHHLVALQLGEPVQLAVLVRELEVGEGHSGLDPAHRGSSSRRR